MAAHVGPAVGAMEPARANAASAVLAALLLPTPAAPVASRGSWAAEARGAGSATARGSATSEPAGRLAAASGRSAAAAAVVTAGAWVAGKRRRRGGVLQGTRRVALCLAAAKRSGAPPPRRNSGGREWEGRRSNAPEEQEDDIIILPAQGMPVTDLAAKLRKPPAAIITYFFAERGKPLTIKDMLNRAMCEDVARKFGLEVFFDDEEEITSAAKNRGILKEVYEDSKPRPPVVTVMGHVDHGKTTLLDTIRKRSVAATEAGGITQRIGAYTVEVDGQKTTFIDTPGHEAFTAMRARGAQVTDIAVLVVAADDGVMPQTREAIAHAKAAEVPIVVAINKCDLPQANPEQARQNLAEEGLVCEEWGGEVAMVEVSAKKGVGIDNLLEVINLTAEVCELQARFSGPAAGIILESALEPSRGVLATALVQRGTLRPGDAMVAGVTLCKVRNMLNEAGNDMKEAEPSAAVQIIGFSEPPEAGDQFEVYSSMAEARQVIETRERALAKNAITQPLFVGAVMDTSDKLVRLAVILKTDAQGSIAAVKHMFNSMKDSKYVNLRWVLAAPGPVTESDIELAATCPKDQRAMVVAFNTTVMSLAQSAARARKVEVRSFKVIYELFETIVAALQDQIGPEEQLVERGRAEILAVFNSKLGTVAGTRVVQGLLTKGHRVKVYRRGVKVSEGEIISLRVGKSDVKEVDEDTECGFCISGWDAWEAGDEVRCYEVSIVKPQLVAKDPVRARKNKR